MTVDEKKLFDLLHQTDSIMTAKQIGLALGQPDHAASTYCRKKLDGLVEMEWIRSKPANQLSNSQKRRLQAPVRGKTKVYFLGRLTKRDQEYLRAFNAPRCPDTGRPVMA